MTFSAKITAAISATQVGPNDFGGPEFTPEMKMVLNLADGTTAGRANRLWADVRTLAPDTSEVLDLTGALADAFGGVLTQAELVAIMLINAPRTGPANSSALSITRGGGAPMSGVIQGSGGSIGLINPGGLFLMACDHINGIGPIVAGTADTLNIFCHFSAGAGATYQIMLIGRSA